MRIVVTGGAGFIGSNLVYQLLELGGEVLIIDDLSTGLFENVDPRAGFRHIDICDDSFVDAVVDFKPDVVVHLAAQSSVAEGLTDPEGTRRSNIDGVKQAIKAVHASGASRLIFASSAAVYGDPVHLPIAETDPTIPINLYGETKLEGERLIREAFTDGPTDFVLLRFANVYGPKQGLKGEGGVVSAFASTLVEGGVPFIEGDGNQTRDFIFVGDIVFALISCIGGELTFKELPQDTPNPGVFNICTGSAHSIQELGAVMRMTADFFGPYEKRPAREGDITESVLDGSRARAVFEFMPDTSFENGIESTYLWFKGRHAALE